jgi:uncharacterized SAM-binding protein YcdF (DUF218 family)
LHIGRLLRLIGFAALGLIFILLAGGFLTFVHRMNSYPVGDRVEADGIVVLTGGAQRIAEAAELLSHGHAKRMLITGVNLRTSREQIVALNTELTPLVDCCVDLDYRARNTIGNAIGARRWILQNGFGSVIVVTSNYHMPRTLVELANVVPGVRLVPYAVEHAPTDRWWNDPGTARLLFTEYVKYLAASLRTVVETDPEHSRMAVVVGGRKPALKGPMAVESD